MKYQDIKVGEMYNVRVKVIHVDAYKNTRVNTVDENGKQLGVESTVFYAGELRAFSPITPENGAKNTESAPKYDPCRLFRKGDKVRLVPYRGRAPIMFGSNVFSIDEIFTVEEDENKEYDVMVNGASHRQMYQACFLELVTPVEEREPYFVMELKGAHGVYNTRFQPETEACHFYTDMHPNAKAAAEAECARLNAEYRKEKE
jgi:hypothetical protein